LREAGRCGVPFTISDLAATWWVMALAMRGDQPHGAPGLGCRWTWPAFRPVGDGFELLVLVALAVVSVWVIVLDLRWSAARGVVWTGIDGELPVDQMQYLAWVQDASRHLLVSDLFVVRGEDVRIVVELRRRSPRKLTVTQ
jgi:hypothetical protein